MVRNENEGKGGFVALNRFPIIFLCVYLRRETNPALKFYDARAASLILNAAITARSSLRTYRSSSAAEILPIIFRMDSWESPS